jgi:hypothetical protein
MKTRTQNKKGLSYVENLKDFKSLLKEGYYEYLLQLGGGIAFSRKSIFYDNGKFQIVNHIDDTEQNLTEKQLMNKRITNVGLGIKRRALIVNLKEKI